MKKSPIEKARDKFGAMIYKSCIAGEGRAVYYCQGGVTWLSDGYVLVMYPKGQFPFSQEVLIPHPMGDLISGNPADYIPAKIGAMAVDASGLIVRLLAGKQKTSVRKKYLDIFADCSFFVHESKQISPIRVLDEQGVFFAAIMPFRVEKSFWRQLI